MSEPTAGEVLGMLADFVEASVARDEAEAKLRGAGKLTDEGRGFSVALRREAVATDALLALSPAHLRALAAALTAPAPAEADELRAEVERLEGLLRLAGPALRAAQTYHYKRAHAAHALPGSRDRAGYEIEANEALFRLRLDSAQKGAAAVLAALKSEEGEE